MSKSLQVLSRCSSDETISAGNSAQIVLFTSIETDSNGTDSDVEMPVSVDATLSDLGIKITANSLDDDCVFTLSKNTTETSLQVTVATTDTGWFTDDTNTVSVATSTTTPDKISIKVDASAATSGSISFSVAHIVYDPDTASETLTVYGCNRSGNINMDSASATYYFTPHGATGSSTSNATNGQRVSRLAGDLKFFTAWAATNNRTTDVDFVVNVEGSDGNNSLTFTSSDNVMGDYTSTDTLAVGDEIYYKGDTGTGTEAFTLESLGSQIVTSDDKFAFTSGSVAGEVTSEGTTEYIPLGGELDEGFATEAEAEVTLPFDMDFLELFADMRSVLSVHTSTINLRVNGVTELTVTPDAAGEFTDTGTISASAGDTACIQIITATGGSAFRPYEIVVVAQEAAGGGPQTIVLGLASETDTGQSVTHSKQSAMGLASEADTATAITHQKQAALAQAVETDTAHALAHSKAAGLSLATEADTALPIVHGKQAPLGQAAETDSGFSLIWHKSASLGLAQEADTAFPVTQPGQVIDNLGLASETDSAFGVSHFKQAGLGLAAEAATALPLLHIKQATLGLSSEADSGFSLIWHKSASLGLAQETDTAHSLVHGKRLLLGQASVVNSALPVSVAAGQTAALGQAAETDTGFGLVWHKSATLGLAQETDTALPLSTDAAAVFVPGNPDVWLLGGRDRAWQLPDRGRAWIN